MNRQSDFFRNLINSGKYAYIVERQLVKGKKNFKSFLSVSLSSLRQIIFISCDDIARQYLWLLIKKELPTYTVSTPFTEQTELPNP